MQLVSFICPHCTGAFQVDRSHPGTQAACPTCGGIVAIPLQTATPVPVPPTTNPPPQPPPQPLPPPPPNPATIVRSVHSHAVTSSEPSPISPPPAPLLPQVTPVPQVAPAEPMLPETPASKTSTNRSSKVDSLLPPEAGDFGGADYTRPLPLPSTAGELDTGTADEDDENFATVALDDTIRISEDIYDDEPSDVTPDHYARVRFLKNLIMFLVGLIILFVTLWLLSDKEPVIEREIGAMTQGITNRGIGFIVGR